LPKPPKTDGGRHGFSLLASRIIGGGIKKAQGSAQGGDFLCLWENLLPNQLLESRAATLHAPGHIEETNLQCPALAPHDHAATMGAIGIEQDIATRQPGDDPLL
jgi:hypothetical protein